MPRTNRPDTGPMRFDGDWPGFFLRGDNALDLANLIAAAIDSKGDLGPIQRGALTCYVRMLRSSHAASATGEGAQELKSWAECQLPNEGR